MIFKVRKGSELEREIEAYFEGRRKYIENIVKICKKYGFKDITKDDVYFTNDFFGKLEFYGVGVKGDIPSNGWRRKDNYFVPNKKSKLGKEIVLEIKNVQCPDVKEIMKLMGMDVSYLIEGKGWMWFRPSLEKIGDTWIIHISDKLIGKFYPKTDDVEEITVKEYLEMKERLGGCP
ncbi:hypothetical protein [Methanocaldococcus fervens]|uniref:Uncharacterized protein n=1 Tax=Methanocaldococcus fervens (strain DSM 4213 / JCM 15782 / AG86) TaxID=573064 RepID=C7P9Q2_METFA|nr:hypothetical protein [Methanocaldococcus fervens]ACV25409.1 hypothetical protein Mefer_1606 [Methanocaldococcus fervens AG86]